MATGAAPVDIDERGIPCIDPSAMPSIVDGHSDWLGDLDKLREAYPYFRVGDSPSIWFSRWEAGRDIYADAELFYDSGWVREFGEKNALVKGDSHKADISDVCPADELVQHMKMRHAVMDHFAPKYVRTWEPRMRQLCRDLIDEFQDTGECDFVRDFGRRYFPILGCQWLGVPREDWETIVDLVHHVFILQPGPGDDRTLEMAGQPIRDILAYLEKLMDLKRTQPDDSFTSYLIHTASIDGRPLTEEEVRGALTIGVLGSGHTVSAHLGYVFRHLADHPEHRRLVRERPEMIPSLGEELLRIYGLFGQGRTVTRDVEFHGVQLRRGDKVMVLDMLVNRDPDCPGFGEIDVERATNPHLAFNFGARRCIGLHWARASRTIAIEEWHRAIPDYRVEDGAELTVQIYAGTGYRALPLTWK